MMQRDTLVELAGFLHNEAADRIAAELNALTAIAYRANYRSTPYAGMNNQGFEPEHPRSSLFKRECGIVSTDQISLSAGSQKLCQFDELTKFVRRLPGFDALYRSACKTYRLTLLLNAASAPSNLPKVK
jgi:AraC-like DNA-binding protein